MDQAFDRLASWGTLLVMGMVLLLAEGCLAPPPGPLPYQESALPQEQISRLILQAVAVDLAEHPQSREANLLERFYRAERGLPVWINRRGISLAAWQLVAALKQADREGLPPSRYAPDQLRRLLKPALAEEEDYLGWSPEQVAEVDLALSRAFFRYAGDNLWGQERSWRSRGDWHRRRRDVDPALLLALALELDALPSALRGLPPADRQYRQLRQVLQRYRRLAELGGWPATEGGEVLRPGASDPRLSALRNRLQLEGDLTSGGEEPDLFSPALEEGLKAFQRRHGLTPDGALGPRTLQALNVSAEERIAQILRNMERRRWESGRVEARQVNINLAAFSLELVEPGQPALRMPVVIGRKSRPTPLFSSQIESLILEPYWYVPPTLLREALPRIAADASYLRRNHYEVLDGEGNLIRAGRSFGRRWQRGEVEASLRQQPGPWNPMGQIKFQLPNPWSIYLHDTPKKQLFARTERAYSSGCIRLSEPHLLARRLLQGNALDREQVEALLASRGSRFVEIADPVALYIGYWTAWVDEAGRINFRDDIYGRDLRLARELRQGFRQLALID